MSFRQAVVAMIRSDRDCRRPPGARLDCVVRSNFSELARTAGTPVPSSQCRKPTKHLLVPNPPLAVALFPHKFREGILANCSDERFDLADLRA